MDPSGMDELSVQYAVQETKKSKLKLREQYDRMRKRMQDWEQGTGVYSRRDGALVRMLRQLSAGRIVGERV